MNSGSPLHDEINALTAAFYCGFDNRHARQLHVDAIVRLFAADAEIIKVGCDRVDRWAPLQFVTPRVEILNDGTLVNFHEWEIDYRMIAADTVVER